jgi:hypothetical protein
MGLTENTATALLALNGLDVWRRITCDWLAGMVLTNIVDEEEAPDMAREFAYGLAERAYGFQIEPVGKT